METIFAGYLDHSERSISSVPANFQKLNVLKSLDYRVKATII
jgi:hypothetical protein